CNATGDHTCMSTGADTQNDVQILLALFGPAGAQAPMLKVTNPTNGSAQSPGFTVNVDCTSSDGIQEVDISVDGKVKKIVTVPPFTYATEPTLVDGPHTVSVLCATTKQAITTVTNNVTVGTACVDGACAQAGYICWDGACVAGPEAPGGLGAPCTGG